VKEHITYHTRQNFEGRKFSQIWQILPNLPKFSYPIKRIDFEKLNYKEYSPIYCAPIIADSSFTKNSPSKILSCMVYTQLNN